MPIENRIKATFLDSGNSSLTFSLFILFLSFFLHSFIHSSRFHSTPPFCPLNATSFPLSLPLTSQHPVHTISWKAHNSNNQLSRSTQETKSNQASRHSPSRSPLTPSRLCPPLPSSTPNPNTHTQRVVKTVTTLVPVPTSI